MKLLAIFVLLIAAIPSDDIGISVYPNATEIPEVTARLMEKKEPTWIAARAYRTGDSIKDVVQHFREQAARGKKPSSENQILDRLFADNWQITESRLSGAHVVFGVRNDLPGADKERTDVSFGTILLDDSLVRVHIMTPIPDPPEGVNLVKGTMIVLIRERIPEPSVTAASAEAEEEVFTARDVTRKVRIRSKPHPNPPPGLYGTVVLKAVFASSGKVTKIIIVKGVPGLTEVAIKAARQITFDPAIKDGRYVAQWMQLEYNVN